MLLVTAATAATFGARSGVIADELIGLLGGLDVSVRVKILLDSAADHDAVFAVVFAELPHEYRIVFELHPGRY